MSVQEREVPADKLAVVCNPLDLGFETTDEIGPLEGTIGQERAVSALELALDINAQGFNLFISGVPGTGRNTALRSHVQRIAATKPVPSDWGYLYNFQDPSQPTAFSLPCGMMKELARDMNDLVEGCRQEAPKAFESDDCTHRVEEVMKGVQEKRQALTTELEQEAKKEGFSFSFTQVGITPVPVVDGRPINQEEFGGLGDEQREALREKAEALQHSITHAMQEFRRLNQEATDRVREVDVELLRFTLTPIIYDLQSKYLDYPDVGAYLGQVETDMAERLDMFKPSEESSDQRPGPGGPPSQEDVFTRYRVNDLVDNSTCEGAPVIFEYSPTY